MRRCASFRFSIVVVALTISVGIVSGEQACGEQPSGPANVILMMADDLGWGDVRCFDDDSPIKTPNLDAMASSGLKFNRFYSAAPVCSPTRGSCLTGRHPFRYGIYYANSGHLQSDEQTLAEILQRRGYATGHFGKWHLGTLTKTVNDANRGGPNNVEHYAPPWEHGFEVCFSTESKVPTWDPMRKPKGSAAAIGWNYLDDKTETMPYGTRYWDASGNEVTDNLDGDDSRVIMDRVIPFVEQSVQNSQPFFAVIWFHAPHLPVVAGPKYAAQYDGQSDYRRNYFGCVTAMDEQIGRLRKRLLELECAANTMLWFTSDNGALQGGDAPGSNAHFRGGKRSLFEGGIRVPAILEWPSEIAAGSETEFPAVTSDYLPTILEALGGEREHLPTLDGIALFPICLEKDAVREKPIGFQSQKQWAWMTHRYKLYSPDEGRSVQLYDLLQDPSETHDISFEKPNLTRELNDDLLDWISNVRRNND